MCQSADDVYEPLFCPSCGCTLNQLDDLPESRLGGDVQCGWCHRRHSFDGVKRCRALNRISERSRFDAVGVQLLRLRDTLTS